MSIVITWATPERYPKVSPRIAFWLIQKQTGGQGPFVQIAEIPSTTDGLPKSDNNEWIDQYEDMVGMDHDVYQVAAKSDTGLIGQYSQKGHGGYMSNFHALLRTIRYELGDDNEFFYQLDEPQFKWSGTQIGVFLVSALREFNGTGPMLTSFTFDNVPEDASPVLELCVMAKALGSRSIKEIPNKMVYNDAGINFDLSNRPEDYWKAMSYFRQQFLDAAKNWKLSHRPNAIGLGSQRLPFRVSRPLSMLPNMKNVFSF